MGWRVIKWDFFSSGPIAFSNNIFSAVEDELLSSLGVELMTGLKLATAKYGSFSVVVEKVGSDFGFNDRIDCKNVCIFLV